ncbi:hypothetical protein [Burkholderia vietnamiensis]|uniref:hypothetical protein n=1 Tax=Burkholderia vietnamiensis TaxID=60552 RepID=UPI0009BEB91F|nr:hypothetical protein [Burkholderia vietnamiensis]MBR8357805.1 hypothetical protein [Burkholderia vietnamiensis]MDN7924909.1 hypothetical protein [Burkholderia vietnamiensis]MDN8034606.1 hypothetical protein [Burkholderia vietnamiensis]HDR9203320.1 hypothetical protein [Burkholderia vietnamiensis]HDR9249620.1 hypothetical protein [Burkholderia vietnamiensis]
MPYETEFDRLRSTACRRDRLRLRPGRRKSGGGQLNAAGGRAEVLHLPDHRVFGNGHGLIYEKNADEALAPVLNWLVEHTEAAGPLHSAS